MGFCPNIRLNNAPLLSRALVQAKHDKKGLTWVPSTPPLEEGLKVRGLEDVGGKEEDSANFAGGKDCSRERNYIALNGINYRGEGPGEFVNGLPA